MRNSLTCVVSLLAATTFAVVAAGQTPSKGRTAIETRVGNPYLGALVIDPDTGQTLFEDNTDVTAYPASIVKLMVLLIIQERIENGQLALGDSVLVSARAAGMGGSQVYLAEKERFSVEDLLYALIIQSANDAAYALAEHVAGSSAAFVGEMNKRAAELGMAATRFHSVHGLPPSGGDEPDVSTPRDLAILAREAVKHPDILRYTSTHERGFRNGTFIMRSHNQLLETVPGCDGLKTGYFRAGGFSIVATARLNDRRVVAVLTGCQDRKTRDAKAAELIADAFAKLPPPPVAAPVVVTAPKPPAPVEVAPAKPRRRHWGRRILIVIGTCAVLVIGITIGRRAGTDPGKGGYQ